MGILGRKRAAPMNIDNVDDGNTQKNSEYEQLREKRIKENLERMEKLGIFDISLKLKSTRKPTVRKTPQRISPLQPSSGPSRRSSRLQNGTPVSYSEVHLSKIDKSLEGGHHLLREEGSKPEIYTEEHEKLLGNTDLSWTFFVDGYGNDGKRIYDPINGKTCHQCRQKTLGQRTHCSKCQMVQGQFCGDCLYMRYGEHVLEAKRNPDWICPPCRGICNCSLCRQAKGWAPTGALYRKIARLGYKSVAHYLIQTHRASVSSENNSAPVSAKRSLPFSDMESTTKDEELCKYNSDSQGLVMTTQTEVKTVEYDPNEQNIALESSTEPSLKPAFAVESSVEPLLLLKHDTENSGTNAVLSCNKVGNFSADNKPGNENAELVGSALTSSAAVLAEVNDGYKGESQLGYEFDVGKMQSKEEKEDSTYVSDDKNCDGMVAPEGNTELVGSALTSSAAVLTDMNDGDKGESQLGYEFDAGKMQSKEEKEDGTCVSFDKNCDGMVAPEKNTVLVGSALTSSAAVLTELNDVYKGESELGNEFDIGKMQSKEEKEEGTCVSADKNCDGMVAPQASSKSKKKPCRVAAQVVDSVAGRLRQRRGRSNVEA
ncbi:uncharacterized protein LOC132046932 [Lycium ferocissimum]|uniref:uncharacterized protein LOC132046932 n=1 Tax=Lycium ferocissimum TaxID=112874 RepID=UPI00281551CB|nr:uncharacterized protein LOC132046932 [Lycium ferocissimum]